MGSAMESTIRDMKVLFRALADLSRLRMVEQLGGCDEITVTELARRMRMSQPLISWHLGMLRRAGLVSTRRAGRVVHCSLDRSRLAWCHSMLDALSSGSIDRGGPSPAVPPLGQPLNA